MYVYKSIDKDTNFETIIFQSKYYFLVWLYATFVEFFYEPGAWAFFSYKIEKL